MEKIFTDESNETTPPSLQIDFSEALWATDKLNSIFNNAGIPLNDVDFIAETEEELIFVECKNANRIDATNPDFNPAEDKRLNIIARKYYDSLNFCIFSERGLMKRKIAFAIVIDNFQVAEKFLNRHGSFFKRPLVTFYFGDRKFLATSRLSSNIFSLFMYFLNLN